MDVGFGARRLTQHLGGEAVTAQTAALLTEGCIVAVEAIFEVDRAAWPALARRLLEAWDAPAELEPSGFR